VREKGVKFTQTRVNFTRFLPKPTPPAGLAARGDCGCGIQLPRFRLPPDAFAGIIFSSEALTPTPLFDFITLPLAGKILCTLYWKLEASSIA
jgi:hypothetical protein